MKVFNHILVAIDDSPISFAAAAQARELAQLSQSQVTILSVVAVDPFVGVDFYKVAPAITDYFIQAEKHALARLDELALGFQQDGIHVQSKVVHGVAPADGILQSAEELGADLIMMGSNGRSGLEKMVLGSVAQKVLAQAKIPVLIHKAK